MSSKKRPPPILKAIRRMIVALDLNERRVLRMFLRKLPSGAPPKGKRKRRQR